MPSIENRLRLPRHCVLPWICILTGVIPLSCIAGAFCQTPQQLSRIDTPIYSAKATTVYEGKVAVSPDGKRKVTVRVLDGDSRYHPAFVIVETGRNKLSERIQFGLNSEILWSPDSQAFAVTGSIEGANGLYQTDAFLIRDNRLVKVDLTRLVKQAFGHPVRCGWREAPNVGAIAWLIPSQQILVAAQIIHHSNCDSFGTFKAYAVDLKGVRVVRVYDQLKTKRLYGNDLGEELIQADDKCIQDPRSCYVLSNHPEISSTPQ